MTKKLLIGKIIKAHGIKGQVSVMSFSQNPQDIQNYNLFDSQNKIFKLKISGAAKGSDNNIYIATIDGVNDKNAADLLRNTELFANRDEFPEIEEDEYYYSDLIGLDALDMEGRKVGKVINVMDFGAGGMIEVEFIKPIKQDEKICTLPFKNKTVPEVNLKEKYLKIDMPEFVEIRSEGEEA